MVKILLALAQQTLRYLDILPFPYLNVVVTGVCLDCNMTLRFECYCGVCRLRGGSSSIVEWHFGAGKFGAML
jgi:hypothetical protein